MKTAMPWLLEGIRVGFTCFPSFVALVHKNLLYVECTRYGRNIANLRKSTIDGHKHNLTMVSDASPGTTTPKMKKSFVHVAHVSSNCQLCMRTGWVLETSPSNHCWWRYEVGQWLVFGWLGGWGTSDTLLARWKLGKKHTQIMGAAITLWSP